MFKYVLLFALVAIAFADKNPDAEAEIKVLESEINENGHSYTLETSNGISASQIGNENGVAGSFGWTAPSGESFEINYTADENGYQATGDAIPTSPPIPEDIQKSLDWNAAHPDEEKEEKH